MIALTAADPLFVPMQVFGAITLPRGEKWPRQEVLQHFISFTATSELK